MNANALTDSPSRWKLDPGVILSLMVLVISFVTSYAVLSQKIEQLGQQSIEDRSERRALTEALRSLEMAVVRLQTQGEERGKK
jgi:hypothetical protein